MSAGSGNAGTGGGKPADEAPEHAGSPEDGPQEDGPVNAERDARAAEAAEREEPPLAAPLPGAGLAYQAARAAAPARAASPAREALAAEALARCARAGVDPDDDAALAEALAQVELDREIPDALYAALAAILVRVLAAGAR